MGCTYRYISRWSVTPLGHPAKSQGGFQVIESYEDAKTAAAAIAKLVDRYPQYEGMPFAVRCLIPAKNQGQVH